MGRIPIISIYIFTLEIVFRQLDIKWSWLIFDLFWYEMNKWWIWNALLTVHDRKGSDVLLFNMYCIFGWSCYIQIRELWNYLLNILWDVNRKNVKRNPESTWLLIYWYSSYRNTWNCYLTLLWKDIVGDISFVYFYVKWRNEEYAMRSQV